jgi:hypothetical protein
MIEGPRYELAIFIVFLDRGENDLVLASPYTVPV